MSSSSTPDDEGHNNIRVATKMTQQCDVRPALKSEEILYLTPEHVLRATQESM